MGMGENVKIPRIPHYSTLWKHEHPFIAAVFIWGWYFRDDIRSFDDKNLRMILADIGRVGCNLPQRICCSHPGLHSLDA